MAWPVTGKCGSTELHQALSLDDMVMGFFFGGAFGQSSPLYCTPMRHQNQLKRERQKAAKAKQDEADDLAKRNGAHVEPTAAGPPTPVVDTAPPPTAAAAPAPAADPAKKLKNLKKKIKAVDTLQVMADAEPTLAVFAFLVCYRALLTRP